MSPNRWSSDSRYPLEVYPEMTFRDFLLEDEAHVRDYWEFLNPSRYIPFSQRLQKLFWMARPGDTEDVTIYVARIVAWVHDQFDYQKARTHVHSSLDDILKSGGGVCQDFAHLTIGLLRLAGVPARYVSGYLAPAISPTGNASVGEQASHAWLEAWLPYAGWTGFDPTNRYRTDERHIRVAIGRDYADVPPLMGVYRSSATNQVMTVDLNIEHTSTEPARPMALALHRAARRNSRECSHTPFRHLGAVKDAQGRLFQRFRRRIRAGRLCGGGSAPGAPGISGA